MAQATMASISGLKETYVQLKTRMEKAVEDFRKAMASTRTGRASVHMLDNVNVDYYGSHAGAAADARTPAGDGEASAQSAGGASDGSAQHPA